MVILTHGGFVSAACPWFLDIPWNAERSPARPRFFLDPGYTGVTDWSRAKPAEPWLLHRYNDTAHLR